MTPRAVFLAVCCLALAACSSGGGISTASILAGGSNADAAPAVAPPPVNDPTSRAFNVGMVTARAVKCGYNFDPAKLKSNYLASEAALGASGDAMAKIEKVYTVGYNGVTKAATGDPNYCSDQKTKQIKDDLTKLLAGDYTPPSRPAPKAAEDDGGLFSGWGSSGGSDSGSKTRLPTDNSDI
jgi:hypothetical protein